jgi:hypothetical protein
VEAMSGQSGSGENFTLFSTIKYSIIKLELEESSSTSK